MNVLIVDEPSARETLRGFLLAMGYARVLEARTGADALRIMQQERGHVDLVIAELDLPDMSGQALLNALRAPGTCAGLTAFLLLTTDLPPGALRDLRRSIPRFDAQLAKPFRRRELGRAIGRALIRRNSARDALLYIGNISDELLRVRAVLRLHQNHWNRLLHGGTPAELDDCVSGAASAIGGILVDPDAYCAMADSDWLGRFRRTRVGARTPVLCLGRAPERIASLRQHCDWFFEPSASAAEWGRALNGLSIRVTRAHELGRLALKARRQSRNGQAWAAVWTSVRLLRRDPTSSRAHAELAELLRERGWSHVAFARARRAAELNPCSPRAQLMVLELAPSAGVGPRERAAFARAAAAYCPHHPEVRAAVVVGERGE